MVGLYSYRKRKKESWRRNEQNRDTEIIVGLDRKVKPGTILGGSRVGKED